MIGRPYSATDLSSPLVRRLGERVGAFDGRPQRLVIGTLSNVHEDGTATIVGDDSIVLAIVNVRNVSTAKLDEAERLADEIVKMIADDVRAGVVPEGLSEFSQLHDHVDANEYAIQAYDLLVESGTQRVLSWDQRLDLWNLSDWIVERRMPIAASENEA